jgi:glycosyltransferase involved in cell wall biosynthesis
MRVAVIIAARDIAAFLPDAIRSALGQSHAQTAVIVVDDGSADHTPGVIAHHASPRLYSLRTEGLGVSAARNLGARHEAALAADALLFLDGDDWLAPTALQRLGQALSAKAPAAAAYGSFAFVAQTARPGLSMPQEIRHPPPHLSLARLIPSNRFANGGHVLIRRSAWQATGGFGEDLGFAEDWEFWPRLRLQGPFQSVQGAPVLLVRRRAGSLMHNSAINPGAYEPALAAMAGNAGLTHALGPVRLRRIVCRARRELNWTIGREMLRRGTPQAALPLLLRGFFGQFRPQRTAVLIRAAWAWAAREDR